MKLSKTFVSALIAGILLITVFFYRQILFGEVVYCCDNLTLNLPAKLWFIDELKQGIFPLWNPYLFSGMPFWADLNLGLLAPGNLLFFFLTPFRALTYNVILNFFLAFLGMFLLGGALSLSWFASLVAGVIYAFSGTLVVYTNNLPLLAGASLLPLVMFCLVRFSRKPKTAYFLSFVAVLAWQLLSGHPQLTYYSWLLAISYLWLLPGWPWVKKLFWTLTGFGLALAIAGVQLVPFAELISYSTRLGRGFAYATFDSLHPLNLIRFILPNLVGDLSRNFVWAQGGSVYGYLGLMPLLLVMLLKRRKREVMFWTGVALISLLLALGKYTPLYLPVYYLLPGAGSFRSPQHFLLLYTFSLAIISGYALDTLGVGKLRKRIIFISYLLGTGFCAGGFGLLLIGSRWIEIIRLMQANFPFRVFGKLLQLSTANLSRISGLVRDNLFISGGLLLLAAWSLGCWQKKKVLSRTIFLLAIFLDLLLFSSHNLLTIPQAQADVYFQKAKEVIMLLPVANDRMFRLWVDPKIYPYPGFKAKGAIDLDQESAWQAEILRPNLNLLGPVAVIDGYSSLNLRIYQEYFGTKSSDPTGVSLNSITPLQLDILGVRCALGKIDDPFWLELGWKVVWQSSSMALYENAQALPRFTWKNDQGEPGSGINLTRYWANGAALNLQTDHESRLIFTDTLVPGWYAKLDGNPAAILPYQRIFKSVVVPAGKHELVFLYRPISFLAGICLSVMGVVIFAVLLLRSLKEKRRSR